MNDLRTLSSVLVAAALAGCGGGGGHAKMPTATHGKSAPVTEQQREQQEQKSVPGKRLSPADRVAYYQIATTSGLLRARASTVLSGLTGTPRSTLVAGRERLKQVQPDSAALTTLRNDLATSIDKLLAHESHATARAAMRATTAINAALTRFSKGKAVRLVLPD